MTPPGKVHSSKVNFTVPIEREKYDGLSADLGAPLLSPKDGASQFYALPAGFADRPSERVLSVFAHYHGEASTVHWSLDLSPASGPVPPPEVIAFSERNGWREKVLERVVRLVPLVAPIRVDLSVTFEIEAGLRSPLVPATVKAAELRGASIEYDARSWSFASGTLKRITFVTKKSGWLAITDARFDVIPTVGIFGELESTAWKQVTSFISSKPSASSKKEGAGGRTSSRTK